MNERARCSTRPQRSRSLGWVFSSDPAVLARIRDASIDTVVFNRALDPSLLASFDRECDAKVLPRRALLVSPRDARSLEASVAALVDECSAAVGVAIARDIAWISELVASLAGVARVRVAFGSVCGDECTQFHQDFVRLRAIVTYAGPTTVLVERSAVDPVALEAPIEDSAGSKDAIVRDESAIKSAPRGSVVLLKGAAFSPGNFGAVHRSPRLSDAAVARRIVLTVTALASDREELVVEARTGAGQRVWIYPEEGY
ncbi:MAG: DUF1826 domain-containing protein [Myxococcales bacterium]|nr:DUF1826 domain-containing protein [Myxococcales bacterium]